jgi:hypothetical protein
LRNLVAQRNETPKITRSRSAAYLWTTFSSQWFANSFARRRTKASVV